MHLHWEQIRTPGSQCDCTILSLSWMGKVPDGVTNPPNNQPGPVPVPPVGQPPPVGSNALVQGPAAILEPQPPNGPVPQAPATASEGWKLNKAAYYQDGWLATGNVRGVVGVTHTTCRCRSTPLSELPGRMNHNLRGHRSEVTLVKWNEPYQKLATCDSSGIIFVWIKYEGRWSIELINDRNTQVTDFSWSHDGRMALICYMDGFVLVGSVAGQRYWSSMLNLDGCTITCGVWTADDQKVIFGTSSGHMLVINVHGTMVAQVNIKEGFSITAMAWSCEKFRMEDDEEEEADDDGDDNEQQNASHPSHESAYEEESSGFVSEAATLDSRQYNLAFNVPALKPNFNNNTSNSSKDKSPLLAVCFKDGMLFIMKNYDDIFPIIIRTYLQNIQIDWCNSGDYLAVAGHRLITKSTAPNGPQRGTMTAPRHVYENVVSFYTRAGNLRYEVVLDYTKHPITAITWGHNDKRLFVATGPVLHIAWITKRVPKLSLLSRLQIHSALKENGGGEKLLSNLPLPLGLRTAVGNLFGQTIRCVLPDPNDALAFVARPPRGGTRLHCTMIRHQENWDTDTESCYILYLEYLGGLIPILKGKRSSRLKPEFVVYDPRRQIEGQTSNASEVIQNTTPKRIVSSGPQLNPGYISGESDAESVHASDLDPSLSSNSEDEEGRILRTGSGSETITRARRLRRRFRRRRNRENNATNANMAGTGIGTESRLSRPDLLIAAHRGPHELPENERLVLVNSNIWGTRFKILGLVSWLPAQLGTINYRTSLLHLQPRQMSITVKELGAPIVLYGRNASLVSASNHITGSKIVTDDEDDDERKLNAHELTSEIPIAPMSPCKINRNARMSSASKCSTSGKTSLAGQIMIAHSRPCQSQPQKTTENQPHGEEYLTLEIDGDYTAGGGCSRERYSMEMTGPQVATSSSMVSTSTQTSFQSITELLSSMGVSAVPNAENSSAQANNADMSPPSTFKSEVISQMIRRLTAAQDQHHSASNQTQLPLQVNQYTNNFNGQSPSHQLNYHPSGLLHLGNHVGSSSLEPSTSSVYHNPYASQVSPLTSPTRSYNPLPPTTPHRSGRSVRDSPRHGVYPQLPLPAYNDNYSIPLHDSQVADGIHSNHHHHHIHNHDHHIVPTHKLSQRSLASIGTNPFYSSISIGGGLSTIALSSHPPTTHSHTAATSTGSEMELTATCSPRKVSHGGGGGEMQFIDDAHDDENKAHGLVNPVCDSGFEFLNCRLDSNGTPPGGPARRLTLRHRKRTDPNDPTAKRISLCLSLDPEEDDSDNDAPRKPVRRDVNDLCRGLACECCVHQEVRAEPPSSPVHVPRKKSSTISGNDDRLVLGIGNGRAYDAYMHQAMTPTIETVETVRDPAKTPRSSRSSIERLEALFSSPNTPVRLATLTNRLFGGRHRRGSVPEEEVNQPTNIRTPCTGNRSLPATPLLNRRNNMRNNMAPNGSGRAPSGLSLLASPTLLRRAMKQKLSYFDCSSDSENTSDDDDDLSIRGEGNFQNLESFQRNGFRKKKKLLKQQAKAQKALKKRGAGAKVTPEHDHLASSVTNVGEDPNKVITYREFVLHNKAPLWNEVSQVYQLDFGGRVTQESAKNFQIEHQGTQVMQFGRIDGNAYTLDFEYPFCALQALSVALANVTQRLK